MQRMQYQSCAECGYTGLCVNGTCYKCRCKPPVRTIETLKQPEPEEHRDGCSCPNCQRTRFNQLELVDPWRCCRPVPVVFYSVLEEALQKALEGAGEL